MANAQRVSIINKLGITGFPYIDFWMEEGMPCFGRRIFFVGTPGCGKSTTAYALLTAISQTCKQCMTRAMWFYGPEKEVYSCRCGKNDFMNVMLCDMENGADPGYLRLLGAQLKDNIFITQDKKFRFIESNGRGGKFFLLPAGTGEEVYDAILDYMDSKMIDAFAIDALNDLIPGENITEGKDRVGKKAQMHWAGLKKILYWQAKHMNDNELSPTIILTNHLTSTINTGQHGRGGNSLVETGGEAPKTFADQKYLMIPMDINAKLSEGKGIPGYDPATLPSGKTFFNRIRFIVQKNKCTGIIQGSGYYDIWMNFHKIKDRDAFWVYREGSNSEHHKIFDYMNSYGLVQAISKGYRMMGKEFRTQRDCKIYLLDPVKQLWARYLLGKVLFTELASQYLKPDSYIYDPFIDKTQEKEMIADAELTRAAIQDTQSEGDSKTIEVTKKAEENFDVI